MLKGKKLYNLGQLYTVVHSCTPRYLRKKCKYPCKLQKSKYLSIYLVKKGIYHGKYSSVVVRGGLDF